MINPNIARADVLCGESGRTLFRAAASILSACSAPGPCDDAVATALAMRDAKGAPAVEWVASDDELRRFLRATGAYEPEELAAWEESELRSRALWVGACDYRENTRERVRELRRELKLGGPGLDSYAYCADLLCVDCAHEEIDRLLDAAEQSLDLSELDCDPRDTEECPAPSFFSEANPGEAAHCGQCGELLYGTAPDHPDDDDDDTEADDDDTEADDDTEPEAPRERQARLPFGTNNGDASHG